MPIYNIKIPFPKKYSSVITKKILDWTESLPSREKGYIYSLQRQRIEEREDAQKHYERTRPPQGAEIELVGIRMIEVFNYEDFESLRKSLEKMFPNLDGFHSDRTFREYFQDQSRILPGSSWMNIGWVYRDNKPLGPTNCLHLPNLPPEVDNIQIGLHHILPSTIVIALDVWVKKDFSEQLKKLQETKYLPETKLTYLFLQSNFFGFSGFSSERSQEQAILEKTTYLRKRVETEIKPYIHGSFTNWSNNVAKLPAIEIYGVKGLLNKRRSFVYWANEARNWWMSLSFHLYYEVFYNKYFSFMWSRKAPYTQMPIPHRVLVFWENYLNNERPIGSGTDERTTIFHTMTESLDSILTPLSIIEIIKQKIEILERIRVTVYLNIKKGKSSSLRRQLRVFGELQQELIEAERLFLELDQDRKYIEKDFTQYQLEKLVYLELQPKSGKKRNENFKENIFSDIDYLRKALEEHMNFLNKSYSTHVQYLNLGIVYNLQIVTLTLSIVALIISVIGILNN